MIKFERVNDFKIKLPKVVLNKTKKRFRGDHIFDKNRTLNFLVAKRESGKTVLIYNLIQEMIMPHTKLVIFSSTVFNDPIYLEIKRIYKDRCQCFVDIIDENESCIMDQILQHKLPDNDNKKKEKKTSTSKLIEKISKNMKLSQEKNTVGSYDTLNYIFIFDDLSRRLKYSTYIDNFVKICRNFGCLCIISSQSAKDVVRILPQYDYAYIFPNMNKEDLKTIYQLINTDLTFKDFNQYYEEITKEPHNFLFIDRDGNIRKNLNEKIIL